MEHRAGAPGRHFGARFSAPGEVAAAILCWARQEAGWDEGPVWEPVDFGPTAEPVTDLPMRAKRPAMRPIKPSNVSCQRAGSTL